MYTHFSKPLPTTLAIRFIFYTSVWDGRNALFYFGLMSYILEERIVCNCDICGEQMSRMWPNWKFFWLFKYSHSLAYLNIRKRKTFFWKFRFLWCLLWEEKTIDICIACQNTLKWVLEYLSDKTKHEPIKHILKEIR